MKASLVVKNMQQFRRELALQQKTVRGAGETAVKVEGYRLMRQLQQEIRHGKAGGHQQEALTYIRKHGLKRQPLAGLAKGIRYSATGRGANLHVEVGFLRYKSSNAWLKIAKRQQEGFTTSADARTPIGGTYRELFRLIGSGIRSKKMQKYFFLRGATKSLDTPARPLIVPFWNANKTNTERNIISNFNRKMAGERI